MRQFDLDDQVTEILLEAIAAAREEQEQAPISYPERRVSTPYETIFLRDFFSTVTTVIINPKYSYFVSLSAAPKHM